MKSDVFIDHLIHSIVKTKKAKKVNCVTINEALKRKQIETLDFLIETCGRSAKIDDMQVKVVSVADIERVIQIIEQRGMR